MQKVRETALLWLTKANDDLLWAQDSLESKHFAGVCFLSQQIAEKALKAYLFFKGEKLLRTHDLFRLLKRCKGYEADFEKFVSAVTTLNAYYIDTRYPDIWDMTRFEDKKLASQALSLTEELIEFIEEKLG